MIVYISSGRFILVPVSHRLFYLPTLHPPPNLFKPIAINVDVDLRLRAQLALYQGRSMLLRCVALPCRDCLPAPDHTCDEWARIAGSCRTPPEIETSITKMAIRMNTDMEVHTSMNGYVSEEVGTRQKVRACFCRLWKLFFPSSPLPFPPTRLMIFLSLSLCVHKSDSLWSFRLYPTCKNPRRTNAHTASSLIKTSSSVPNKIHKMPLSRLVSWSAESK